MASRPADTLRQQHHIDLNATSDDDGMTPLHRACQMGHLDALDYLLGLGADPEVRCDQTCADGSIGTEHLATPLLLAAGSMTGGSKVLQCLERLVAASADLNARDRSTTLACAATAGHIAMINVLLAHGADVNRMDSNRPAGDFTALCHAAADRHLAIVKRLLDHGADPTLTKPSRWRRKSAYTAVRAKALWTICAWLVLLYSISGGISPTMGIDHTMSRSLP